MLLLLYFVLNNFSHIIHDGQLFYHTVLRQNPNLRDLFLPIALKDIFAMFKFATRSVNDRVISRFREGLIFAELRICEISQKLKSSPKFPNLQYFVVLSIFCQ